MNAFRTNPAVFLLTLLLSFLGAATASAGTVMAETRGGKVVTLKIVTYGSWGTLGKAVLTIHDKNGKLLASEEYKEAAQFCEMIHGAAAVGRSLVVFTNPGKKLEVSLRFVGTNRGTETREDLLKILKDPKRAKEKGNSLYVTDLENDVKYEFADIVYSNDGGDI